MIEQVTFKKTATASAVAAALAIQGGVALAQTAPAEDRGQIQEVIVTAQRIAQPASKTPLSLSVLSGDELKQAGAVNASSLTELVPNVQIANNGGATVINIRGVVSMDTTEKGDPSASFNVDGVNLARPQSAGLAFYDLERVEVLRGPQGTLYGRNATAGAINLISNKPVDRFESSAALEVGNYDSLKFDGMVNAKVDNTLSVRAAVSSSKHDGYLRNTRGYRTDYDDDDSLSGRLQGLFKFTPDMSLLVSADASSLKGSGPGQVLYTTYRDKRGAAQRTNAPSVQGLYDNRAHGVMGEFKANTGIGEVTYQAAHRYFKRDEDWPQGVERPGQPDFHQLNLANYSQTSHELRLASTFGLWRTIGGLYWFKEVSNVGAYQINRPSLGAQNFVQSPVHSNSKAAFGEATYSVTPDMHLIAGIRRTNDDKSRRGATTVYDPVDPTKFVTTVNDAAVSYAQTTGRIGVDYQLDKRTMVYATLSTGYKAGGFNDGSLATRSASVLYYNPERLTSLELGVKGRFLDGRLQVNADVFSYAYKDQQLSSVAVNLATGATSSFTLNAAKSEVRGLEVEGKYAISSAGRINFSGTYLDAHFKDYKPTATIDWSGVSLEKSPRTTFGLGYSHTFDMESGASLTAYAGTRFSASYVLNDYGNRLQVTQDAFHKSDVNLSYSPASLKWSVQAYMRNIENKTVMQGYTGTSVVRGPALANLAPPRTAGVRLVAYF
nr:TonB-dependent receptor [uncultured Duganella sp.]